MRSPSCCIYTRCCCKRCGRIFRRRTFPTNAVMPHACPGTVDLIAKEDGIVPVWRSMPRVFTLLDPGAKVEFFCRDGDTVQPDQKLAVVTGRIRPAFR